MSVADGVYGAVRIAIGAVIAAFGLVGIAGSISVGIHHPCSVAMGALVATTVLAALAGWLVWRRWPSRESAARLFAESCVAAIVVIGSLDVWAIGTSGGRDAWAAAAAFAAAAIIAPSWVTMLRTSQAYADSRRAGEAPAEAMAPVPPAEAVPNGVDELAEALKELAAEIRGLRAESGRRRWLVIRI